MPFFTRECPNGKLPEKSESWQDTKKWKVGGLNSSPRKHWIQSTKVDILLIVRPTYVDLTGLFEEPHARKVGVKKGPLSLFVADH